MSNFRCDICGKNILDSPRGYVTGCPHYPLSERTTLSPNLKGRIRHDILKKMREDSLKELKNRKI